MTQKIVNVSEIEEVFGKYADGRLSLSVIDDLRTLLDKSPSVSGEADGHLSEFAKQPIGKILKNGEIDLYDTIDVINEMNGFEIFIHPQHAVYTKPQPDRVAELEAKLKVASEALGFYANRKNWHKDSQFYGSFEVSDYNIIYNDFYEQNQATRYAGNKAREALAKIKD